MARYRRKKAPEEEYFEILVKLASTIPWWITLPAALLLFIFIPFEVPGEAIISQPSDVTGYAVGFFVGVLFKYVLPLALFFGTLISFFESLKSITLFKDVSRYGAHETIKELSWQDFEFLLSEWFKKQGFDTDLVGGGGADGGIDIKLYKNKELYLVQCKHYKAWKVSVNVVRELFGVMVANNAVGGFIVTSGKFTSDAYNFARDKNIELINGEKLEKILDTGETHTIEVSSTSDDVCPRCGNSLVKRNGKYGSFLGCSKYPKCRFTKETAR